MQVTLVILSSSSWIEDSLVINKMNKRRRELLAQLEFRSNKNFNYRIFAMMQVKVYFTHV